MTILADIKSAYDKLKSYVYYDNFSLDLRVKLAEYEDEIKENLQKLADELKIFTDNGSSEYIDDLIEGIKVKEMPKKLTKTKLPDKDDIFYISNIYKKKKYECEKVTHFIDCSIDLHIISFLWILKIGVILDDKLSEHCYAYRPVKKSYKKKVWHKKVFPRYYEKYQYWRDNALKAAGDLHLIGDDVAIISLDIKEYYDSVDLNLNDLLVDDENQYLNDILIKVHKAYQKKRRRRNNLLPIGLVSSGMLANFYLHRLDEQIMNKVRPKFYGRYVDDLLLVISNPVIEEENPNKFIYNLFVKTGILEQKDDEYSIPLLQKNIYIQREKFKVYHFKASEPITLLDEFRRTIRQNSSEFRHLPERDTMFGDFTAKSVSITYSDTINKIRSIEGVSHDKYGASKHLANILFVLKHTNIVDTGFIKTINKQIREFFIGQRCIEFNGLWEKVFTVFTINKDYPQIIDFFNETLNIILNTTTTSHTVDERLQKTLINHLINSLAISVAIDYPSFSTDFFNELNRIVKDKLDKQSARMLGNKEASQKIKKRAKNLINSNLFRHNFVQYPLLGLCMQKKLISFRDSVILKNANFSFNQKCLKYYPRFIPYHELQHFYHLKNLCKSDSEYMSNQDVLKEFLNINKINEDYQHSGFPVEKKLKGRRKFIDITLAKATKSKLKISIVNTIVNEQNSKLSYLNSANLSFSRMSEINHVLNLSAKEGADIIVFPEISIPYHWVDHLADFSMRNEIVVICGVEHISNREKEVFNFSATILPFNYGGFKNVITDLRLKKDYSPEEIRQIEGHGYKVPNRVNKERLGVYKWKGCIFTVFNCFELADIKKRALFKGNVDFVIAIEHNKDTKYFSNIAESATRDIHSYVIQVNSSHFGDSRITQPSKTHMKDIVRIKGGVNTTIITGEVNIMELREFQNKDYNLQKDHEYLKPTPPRYRMWSKRKLF